MRKNILAIIGSASKNSSNLKLVEKIAEITQEEFNITIFDKLSELPHFCPELSIENTPIEILNFRNTILKADGLLICTPEYIFSIPSGLKNAIEWCVSTTVFFDKPLGLITASANGLKGHEELQMIMRTLDTRFNENTLLLIQGIKGKLQNGNIVNTETLNDLNNFIRGFKALNEI